MGIAVMEEIIKTVGSILKTLECPICLELLKTPVSAGCGHFFCRECISETLQANYRAPCPLCKRSFTRRSIQEAAQRQTVILAAEALAKTCSSLTGVNFILQGTAAKEGKKSLEGPLPSAKKLKVSPKEKQNGVSKKRKSCENEDSVSQADVDNSNSELQNPTDKMGDHSDITGDECASAKKRLCYESDKEEDVDSGDLPSLDEIFSQRELSSKVAKPSKFDNLFSEKPLIITPTDKASTLKTYSNFHRKQENKLKTPAELNSNISEKISHTEKCDGSNLLSERDENEVTVISAREGKQISLKNKINALKNKTNEGESEKYILQEDCFLAKVKDNNNARKGKVIQAEQETGSKENELYSSTTAVSNESSSKNPNSKKSKKKLNKKRELSNGNTEIRPDKDFKNSSPMKCTISSRKTSSTIGKNENNNKCYTLNETAISPHSLKTENAHSNLVDDQLGLTDTAVSVDAVKSPLTGRALSFKSPGWSRVKKVKKDFKVKKFSALQVEKNSPFASNKQSRPNLDSVGSEQEAVSPGINSADQSFDEEESIKTDLVPQCNFNDNVELCTDKATKQNNEMQNKPVELDILTENEGRIPSDNKEVSKSGGCCTVDYKESSKLQGRANNDLEENNHAEVEKEIYEEMDCSGVPTNGSHGFNVSNMENDVVYVPNTDMQNFGVKNLHSSTETKVLTNENVMSQTSNVIDKRKNSKTQIHIYSTQDNEDNVYQNQGNTKQDFRDPQVANELNESSGCTSLTEGKGIISKKEKVVSKHAYVVYDNCSESNSEELCSKEFTPKRKKTVMLKTQIAEYQRVHTQSLLNEDEDLQYVEHSQQTSQVALNFDHQTPVYNNFALMAQQQTSYLPQQYPPLPCGNLSTGKTKVVKRTCLTLDEIQDYFYKSNMNNSSEKVCSLPFLSGQYMLDICVSEETLNVSVLKVIDQNSESVNSALFPVPAFSDKGIQSSSTLFNVPSPVLPSSNSSEPNCIPEPFPYLNKLSQDLKDGKSSKFAEETNAVELTNVVQPPMKENSMKKLAEVNDNLDEDVARDDYDMSEIIHFPSKESIQEDDCSLQKGKDFDETEHCKNSNEDYLSTSQETALAATEPFLQVENKTEIDVDSSDKKGDSKTNFANSNKLKDILPVKKDKSPEFQEEFSDNSSDSDREASLRKLQQCASKELVMKGKKLSRLSLKKKSRFRRTQICDSSDESDIEQDSMKKNSGEKQNVTSVMLKEPSEITLASKISPGFKEPNSTGSVENAGNISVAPEHEIPYTLNSVLSEDVPESNASEIIMEIEDLSDKIKFLEEKLKQCGHVDEQKSENTFMKERKTSPVNSSTVHESDSEDSNDLFPQSVPPTPPETCRQDVNSSYKSSFYKTC